MLTDEQVRVLRKKREMGKTQETAAAAAGMSVRSARTWEAGQLPSATKKTRDWRTRADPFEEHWESDVVPLLQADKKGVLQAKAVLGELIRRHEGRYSRTQLRTLQRRVRDWRALHGAGQEVYFPQEHPPGREGALDFTNCNALGVTIAGVLFPHLLFTFRLSHSGWQWIELASSETYEALLRGFQGALWALGGVPDVVRHDNLSAATRELKKSGGRALTTRWQAVMDHYGCRSTRIKPGKSNENGGAEKGNHLIKSMLEQQLLLRGSRDFDSTEHYLAWARERLGEELNAAKSAALAGERDHLNALPSSRLPNYTVYKARVRRWSTVRVNARAYSVPSRLIGHEVTAHQHADTVEVYYGDTLVETMPRLVGDRGVRIDYRHVIWSLVRKPGAFARYKYREELFPTPAFRQAYDLLQAWREERGDIEYVRILHLAASTMESRVHEALVTLIDAGARFDYAAVQAAAAPPASSVPDLKPMTPDLSRFDRLIGGAR